MNGLVRFYACDGDPLRVAAKLLGKAREQGQSVLVNGPASTLSDLGALLWSQPGFFAHAAADASPAVLRRSGVRLGGSADDAFQPALLINLDDSLDCSSAPWPRVFELVGPSPDERAGGRRRFKRHEQVRGVRPEHVKVAP